MRIDGDSRFTEGRVEYDVGRFSPDAGQCLQFFARTRHFTSVLFDEYATSRYDVSGFTVEKANGAYVWRQTIDAECEDGLGRSRNRIEFCGCLVDADIGSLC